jgi:hypothetical protein
MDEAEFLAAFEAALDAIAAREDRSRARIRPMSAEEAAAAEERAPPSS